MQLTNRHIGPQYSRTKAIVLFAIIFLGWTALTLFQLSAEQITALIPALCPIKNIFSVPCPGCGMTHSFISIFQGEFAAAWRFNPFSYLLLALFAVKFSGAERVLSSKTQTIILSIVLVGVLYWWVT